VAAIVLAILSLALFALAAGEWLVPRVEDDSGRVQRAGWRGNLLLFGVSLASVGALLLAVGVAGWNRDRALWVGVGTGFGWLTILRPWWFWENYKARWLRELIGDGATMVIYLALAGVMIWVGLHTDWPFGRR
jgi:hypothetical protein